MTNFANNLVWLAHVCDAMVPNDRKLEPGLPRLTPIGSPQGELIGVIGVRFSLRGRSPFGWAKARSVLAVTCPIISLAISDKDYKLWRNASS